MFNFQDETHRYILFIDIEFDQMQLVQFCGLLFQRVDGSNYVLQKSLNAYVNTAVSYYFTKYTHISQEFLQQNGVPLPDVRAQIFDDLLGDVDPNHLLLVSHGTRGDINVLKANGIDLAPNSTFCTFENAKRILHRKKNISLEDLGFESAYYPVNEHNAFTDAWLTVGVYGYLKDME